MRALVPSLHFFTPVWRFMDLSRTYPITEGFNKFTLSDVNSLAINTMGLPRKIFE